MKGKFLLFFYLISIGSVLGQTTKISGVVTDATDQQPLIGVSVNVQGSNLATQTDIDGKFSINVAPDATLIFSYLGYLNKAVPVNQRAQINITLSRGLQELEQVVVVGYGTQRKRDLTGSITTVKGEDIARSPNIQPLASLQGKVPGLTIVNGGGPGASPTVRIRGINSTNGSDPLYVVDGVLQSSIDYLNAAEIESIEVLKDPSSMAIFGIKGGNGVIVITTKRAAKGTTSVSYQGSAGLQKITKFIDVVDAAGFKKLYEAQLNNIPGSAPFDYSGFNADTDWQDLVTQTASMQNHSVSLSNSGEKSTTLLNLGYNQQEGVVKYGSYKRFTARLNQEMRISRSFKVGADVTGNYYDTQNSGVNLNRAIWAVPIVPAKFSDEIFYRMPSFQTQVANPLAEAERARNTSINDRYRVVGSVFGEVTILKQFKWRSAFYTDISRAGNRGYTPLPFEFITIAEAGVVDADTSRLATARTATRQRMEEFRKFQQDHTLSYDSVFNGKHRVNVVAGFTSIFEGNSNIQGNRTDTTLTIPEGMENLWYINTVPLSNPSENGGGGDEQSLVGYLARVNYAYANKYLINASIRRDGNSRISPENRFQTFGAVGLGWVISEEGFFKNKVVDFLKLRASWGKVGNTNGLGTNRFEATLSTNDVGVFGENLYPAVKPAFKVDSNLRWEVTSGIDIGLDLRALNGRLSVEAGIYDRTTDGIISRITLPNTNELFVTNLGSITNKGVEVALGWNDKIGKDFTYSFSPNFSINKNKVESIGDGFNFQLLGNGNVNRTIAGESIGHFFGYKQIGIYQTIGQVEEVPGPDGALPGDIMYEDTNKDGKLTPEDRVNLGSPFPKWNYGFNFSMGYKKFDFLLQGQGVAGNYVYTERRTQSFAILNYESNRLNAWTGPGSTNVEPILNNSRTNNLLFSDHYLEPGDYFRLRTVQLGYTLDSKVLKKTFVKGARLYVSGQNIKTWSKTTGYSPEAPIGNILGGGADNGVYPIPAIYTFGINASF